MGHEEKDATREEAVNGALEKLLLVEQLRMESGPIELRELERVFRRHVLIEDAQCQHGLRRVEQIVDGDEERLEKRLKSGRKKNRTSK